MKRYIAILLACILMIGSLAGCSGKNSSKDTEDTSKTTTEDQKELKKVEIHKPSAFRRIQRILLRQRQRIRKN